MWDEIKAENLGNKDYIRKRLLYFDIEDRVEKSQEKISIIEKIREKDFELYNILQKKEFNITQKIAMYIGDGIDE